MANTNLLEVFIVVAEEGSITHAAEKLYISQPALTKAIKQLESELGGKLFVRKSKGVELTLEGREIYDRAKPILQELNGLYSYFDKVNKLETGILRIGTTTSNITLLLSGYLSKFIGKYPGIEIKIVREGENALISGLRNNLYDFALLDSLSLKPDMEIVKNFSVKYSVIGNKAYYDKYKVTPLTRKGFAAEPLALIEAGHTSRTNIDNYFGEFGIKLESKYDMENYGLVLDFIKKGVAIGVANLNYFSGELKRKEIYKINTDFEIDERTISLIRAKGDCQNRAQEAFAKLFK